MCGYVSNSLRNGVNRARAERNVLAANEAGRFYGVGFVTRTGKNAGKVRPCESWLNRTREDAEEKVSYVQGLNPKAVVVLIDCRTNSRV